jgi:formiminotetrahydrofolate cyclodeaminase
VSDSLLDRRCTELLDEIASSAPTPGGGSAAALTGATAAALVCMVASMKATRTGSDHERAELQLSLAHARESGGRLRGLVDEDARAFEAVLAARRLPHAAAGEADARLLAIRTANHEATRVPLETARQCAIVLGAASVALAYGNPKASSDARVAGALAWAGLMGAVENVKVNLEGQAGHPASEEAELLVREAHERLKAFGLTSSR